MAKIKTYMGVFKTNLEKRIKRIENELKKAKKDRDKDFLKRELKEIKSLKKLVKAADKEHKKACPKCGHECGE